MQTALCLLAAAALESASHPPQRLDGTEPNPKLDHTLTLRSASLDVAHYSCSCAASSYDGSPRMLSRGGTPPPINPLEAIE